MIVERARLLRRLGRHREALEAWRDVAHAGGPDAAFAWIEVAKCLEHRERDPAGALGACAAADRLAQRSRLLGRPCATSRRISAGAGSAGPPAGPGPAQVWSDDAVAGRSLAGVPGQPVAPRPRTVWSWASASRTHPSDRSPPANNGSQQATATAARAVV